MQYLFNDVPSSGAFLSYTFIASSPIRRGTTIAARLSLLPELKATSTIAFAKSASEFSDAKPNSP